MNVAPALNIPLALAAVSDATKERAERWRDVVKRLARVAKVCGEDFAGHVIELTLDAILQ